MASPTTFSISALQTELLTDFAKLGYAPFVSTHDLNSLSDLLNILHNEGGFLVARAPVQPSTIFDAIDAVDFKTLTVTDLTRLQTVLSLETIDLNVSATFAKIADIFQLGNTTLNAMTTLRTRPGSRAEVLWGPGKIVHPNEVSEALE